MSSAITHPGLATLTRMVAGAVFVPADGGYDAARLALRELTVTSRPPQGRGGGRFVEMPAEEFEHGRQRRAPSGPVMAASDELRLDMEVRGFEMLLHHALILIEMELVVIAADQQHGRVRRRRGQAT